jgi:dTDP-glucose 4,6-dehydratase
VNACRPLPARDLEEIQVQLGPLWREWAGARILMTGCTGFFGPWLLEPLLAAQDALDLDLRLWVLTRDPCGFCRRLPHLARHPSLELLEGDIRTFSPSGLSFTHLVHGAASSNGQRDPQSPAAMEATIVEGTRHVLAAAQGVSKALFISSGAVYGPQPPDLERLEEDRPIAPLEPGYGEGKRKAEILCAGAPFPVALARCFAFLAPHLPLDAHFAAGNFLGAVLEGRPPVILGDGKAVRSYLYGTDLAVWLYTILLKGQGGRAYNVGSETAVTIRELAQAVGGGDPAPAGRASSGASRYVPSTARARALGLRQTVALPEAIRRTLAFHRQPEPSEVP